MNIYINPSSVDKARFIKRPSMNLDSLDQAVDDIFFNVQELGDDALIDYTSRFDKVDIKSIFISQKKISDSVNEISSDLKAAIETAYANIYKFHASQVLKEQKIETSEGVVCWQKSYPINPVGLYIPGGTAPLFSTVLMLGIPAKIAGCKDVMLCSPPQKDGQIHPATLFAAQLCGIEKIFSVGGAQAIAAMTMGTESIPKVNKIFGPGNQYVTAAKQKAMKFGVSIDLPAGPSEVLVYADDTGNPEYIAADLLSQAEHGTDSQVILVVNSESIAKATMSEVLDQTKTLPRKEIVEQCLKNSVALVIEDISEAFEFINDYAPEHFIIASSESEKYIPLIQNAGSVFLGNYSPESAGDYASGTNHTLPTSGFAKSYSGTNLDAYVKKITFQRLSKKGIRKLGDTIMTMAREEQLEAHARAVEVRLKEV